MWVRTVIVQGTNEGSDPSWGLNKTYLNKALSKRTLSGAPSTRDTNVNNLLIFPLIWCYSLLNIINLTTHTLFKSFIQESLKLVIGNLIDISSALLSSFLNHSPLSLSLCPCLHISVSLSHILYFFSYFWETVGKIRKYVSQFQSQPIPTS